MHASTPKEIVKALHQEIVGILMAADTRDRFTAFGFDIVGNTPEQFQSFIEAEVAKWGRLVRDANLQAD